MPTIGNSLTRGDSAGINSGNAIAGIIVSSWPENGDVTIVRVNLQDTGGAGDTFQVGIYSGNTRIGLSASNTSVGAEGTYEFSFSPAVSLTASSEYIFAVGSNSAAGATYGLMGVTGTYQTRRSAGSGGLPPSTNSGGWDVPGTWACFEIEYTVAASVDPIRLIWRQ